MKVVALPEVQQYLESLKKVLFENEYFGFEDAAQEYVDDLFNDIATTLPIRLRKPAPEYFSRYGKGMEYAAFKKSKHTTWYVFFTTYWENEEAVYLVRYINNNHVIAQHL